MKNSRLPLGLLAACLVLVPPWISACRHEPVPAAPAPSVSDPSARDPWPEQPHYQGGYADAGHPRTIGPRVGRPEPLPRIK